MGQVFGKSRGDCEGQVCSRLLRPTALPLPRSRIRLLTTTQPIPARSPTDLPNIPPSFQFLPRILFTQHSLLPTFPSPSITFFSPEFLSPRNSFSQDPHSSHSTFHCLHSHRIPTHMSKGGERDARRTREKGGEGAERFRESELYCMHCLL